MLENYVKIAWRNLWKQKSHSATNIIGLMVAFSASTLLLLSAYFEFSYDRFHKNASYIFRPYLIFNEAESTYKAASVPYPFIPTLKAEFPEISKATRFIASSGKISYQTKELTKDIRCADPDILTLFSFPMRQGNASTALNSLSNLVISEKMAKDVFGTNNPLGKSVLIRGFGEPKTFIVTGVVADAPANSSLQYDAFIRIENQPNYTENKRQWNNRNHTAYVSLKPGTSPEEIDKRLRAFANTYFQELIRDLTKNGARPDEHGSVVTVGMQPLTDVHFNTHLTVGQQTGRRYLYILITISTVILLIALINFINLTLAQSFTRAREVGVRKSLGAQKSQLFAQLWGEAILICSLSLLLGVGLAALLLPYFNTLFNAKLSLALLTNPLMILTIAVGLGLITLLAGGYPALRIARFSTVNVLKGVLTNGKLSGLRNSLIITQFAIACTLIICTFIVLRQLHYLRDKPLGFIEEQVISLPVGDEINGVAALRQLRNRLANNPQVMAVSGTAINIGSGLDGGESQSRMGFMFNGKEVVTDWLRVDYDYLKTLGIHLQAGRDFTTSFATDSTSAVLINATMAKKLGPGNQVGTIFKAGENDNPYQVVGVIDDFHLYRLQNRIEPMTLHLQFRDPIQYILIRTTPQGMLSVMKTLKNEWGQIAPKSEFLASFLDDNTDRWYKQEERQSQMYGIAAGIAILLSCMGLFAIVILSTEQRTKEIGIRKVLGASVASLVTLLSKDFLKLIVIAVVIASSLAWYAMNQWLQDFAYKIEMEWWVFVGAGLLAIGIALLTVSLQSVKAALMNPVRSLKSD
ncbi:ABC transporter permease [Dyadobacter arcticus]|uniref:ABC-type antimicrobial peptide transport system permease subunit n=1 Tax=Dyadobacter arcticus TaxID=1078754 RepID=A0ABX0UNX8_9BACT|nr:ABC transporter permease [Dyadobacter arcticus]NIJ54679.1 ABC-type antimicrobial peptide transport system permease subunit [Dyadobacter arcticus]